MLIPDMQLRAVEVEHWMTAADFSQLFALSQAAPGPNVLIVSLIGWKVAGVLGGFVSARSGRNQTDDPLMATGDRPETITRMEHGPGFQDPGACPIGRSLASQTRVSLSPIPAEKPPGTLPWHQQSREKA